MLKESLVILLSLHYTSFLYKLYQKSVPLDFFHEGGIRIAPSLFLSRLVS